MNVSEEEAAYICIFVTPQLQSPTLMLSMGITALCGREPIGSLSGEVYVQRMNLMTMVM